MEQYTYLAHHGIKGQKWGVRRFQNNDGSLTDQGKRRYLSDETKRKIKTAAKVAAGVAGAAAIGYGVYKVGLAGNRLKMATAYKEASKISSNLGVTNFHNAQKSAELRDAAKKAIDTSRRARQFAYFDDVQNYQKYVRDVNRYRQSAQSYMRQAGHLSLRASQLKYYGKKSDQLAYKFVESLIKDPHVDWEIVKKVMG